MGGERTARGLGGLTRQKVANIRKRIQKRKGKRKANSDEDYVFSPEDVGSEEDTVPCAGVGSGVGVGLSGGAPSPAIRAQFVTLLSPKCSGWWGLGK